MAEREGQITYGLIQVVLSRDRERGDVVVDELAPLHEHVRHGRLDVVEVAVEGAAEQARIRQLWAVHGRSRLVQLELLKIRHGFSIQIKPDYINAPFYISNSIIYYNYIASTLI